MMNPLTWILVSGATLCVLALVFRIEEARHRRFAAALRGVLDAATDWCAGQLVRLQHCFRQGTVRLMLHRVMQWVYRGVLMLVRWLERVLVMRVRRHKHHAKTISNNISSESHLTAIAEHKRQTALTEREKQKLRSHHS